MKPGDIMLLTKRPPVVPETVAVRIDRLSNATEMVYATDEAGNCRVAFRDELTPCRRRVLIPDATTQTPRGGNSAYYIDFMKRNAGIK